MMSAIKRFLCVAVAIVLALTLMSCDALSDELINELIVYLEDMAEMSTDVNLELKNPSKETEYDDFWDDFWDDDDFFASETLRDDFHEETDTAHNTEKYPFWSETEIRDTEEVQTTHRGGYWGDDTCLETETLPPEHEHIIVELEEILPTCTGDGCSKGLYCEECGMIFIEQEYIPAKGHDLKDWTYDWFPDGAVAGYRHTNCSVCGEYIYEYFDYSRGLIYQSNGDGTCFVVGLGGCTDSDIAIPAYYNGEQVTGIGSCAFESNYNLNSVIIPYGVTYIGSSAFSWCSNMSYCYVPETVTYIGDSAFWYCFALTDLSISENITYIGEGAIGCTGITSIYITESNPFYSVSGNCLIEKESGKLIAGFYNSAIPDDGSVTSIADNAFAGCSDLKEIVIPSSVKSIGSSAFYCCGNLESIIFNEGLEIIGYNAFNACDSLTSIVIPDSVIEIGGSAFTWCQGLEYVVIGRGVKYLYSGAFNECSSLKDVFYVGTESEWESIDMAFDWDSNTQGYNLHFNYIP